ncbi:MAG: DMT family transporter [Desulfosarcinaceae bacterium]|jgi:drug/metabolite transporter (DMT)-like permease
MLSQELKSDGVLLLTAFIWGFAFVAQRMGMDHIGPFMFNGIRFVLGALVLMPLFLRSRSAAASRRSAPGSVPGGLWVGISAGGVLFLGASLQQVGLVYTTAGNAGFITGLYVVIVPILGLALGARTNAGTWLGAGLAAMGLYLLSVTETLSIAYGDLLVLVGAFFWAIHVHIVGRFAGRMEASRLALYQYLACACLSLIVGLLFETTTLDGLYAASLPILYGGAFSVGVAYTLQIVGQRHAHPAHAAILLSLESVFAALGGWLVLGEGMSARSMLGCALMLGGMLLSQLYGFFIKTAGRPLEVDA